LSSFIFFPQGGCFENDWGLALTFLSQIIAKNPAIGAPPVIFRQPVSHNRNLELSINKLKINFRGNYKTVVEYKFRNPIRVHSLLIIMKLKEELLYDMYNYYSKQHKIICLGKHS
jgi:hypothetical protein